MQVPFQDLRDAELDTGRLHGNHARCSNPHSNLFHPTQGFTGADGTRASRTAQRLMLC